MRKIINYILAMLNYAPLPILPHRWYDVGIYGLPPDDHKIYRIWNERDPVDISFESHAWSDGKRWRDRLGKRLTRVTHYQRIKQPNCK